MNMNENTKFCQSCAMPMGQDPEVYGTNADGSKNEDYCSYCYKDGKFTSDMTMQEMINFCVPYMATGDSDMTEETARAMLNGIMPTLKRWKE